MRRTGLLVLGLLLLAACGGGSTAAPETPPAPPRSLAYVGLGASDAVGIGAIPLSNGYVYELARDLEGLADDVALDNLGINGAHVDEIVADALPSCLAADPDVVTLWTGANDLVGGDDPEAFAQSLDVLLTALASQTDALVFVADLPDLTQAPLFEVSPDPDVTTERIGLFNARIAALVAEHGFVLVELSAVPPSDDLFFLDGFHPNNAGHAQIAGRFWTEMAPRLSR